MVPENDQVDDCTILRKFNFIKWGLHQMIEMMKKSFNINLLTSNVVGLEVELFDFFNKNGEFLIIKFNGVKEA